MQRDAKEKEKKEKEKEDKKPSLNETQLAVLGEWLAPIQEGPLEKSMELAGIDIQVVLEAEDMDPGLKLTCLELTTQKNFKNELTKKGIQVNKDVLDSLQRINDFCCDNDVQFEVKGFGLTKHDQTRPISRHYLWDSTRLRRIMNQDDLYHPYTPPGEPRIEPISPKEEQLAEDISQAMQSTAKAMIVETCNRYKKVIYPRLYLAAEERNIAKLKELIKAKADLNVATRGVTALAIAVQKGHREIVQTLIEAKAKGSSGLYFDPEQKQYRDLVPAHWLNADIKPTTDFDFSVWNNIPNASLQDVLFRLLNELSADNTDLLLDEITPRKIEKIAKSEAYALVLGKLDEDKRNFIIKKISIIVSSIQDDKEEKDEKGVIHKFFKPGTNKNVSNDYSLSKAS